VDALWNVASYSLVDIYPSVKNPSFTAQVTVALFAM
jgi:hypothetical protein